MNTLHCMLLAWTIYREAGGEGEFGQALVASVIANRAAGDPTQAVYVVLNPKAFSCWNQIRSPVAWVERQTPTMEDPVWRNCYRLAREILTGCFVPVTKATHYHAVTVRPYWARHLQFCTAYRGHKFYKEV